MSSNQSLLDSLLAVKSAMDDNLAWIRESVSQDPTITDDQKELAVWQRFGFTEYVQVLHSLALLGDRSQRAMVRLEQQMLDLVSRRSVGFDVVDGEQP